MKNMRQLRDRGEDGRDVSSRRVILAVALRFPLTIFLKLVDKGDFEPFQIMIGMQPEYSHDWIEICEQNSTLSVKRFKFCAKISYILDK